MAVCVYILSCAGVGGCLSLLLFLSSFILIELLKVSLPTGPPAGHSDGFGGVEEGVRVLCGHSSLLL
jgi:hypothetical protein